MKSHVAKTITHALQVCQLEIERFRCSVERVLMPRSSSPLELCQPSLRLGPTPVSRPKQDQEFWLDRAISRCLVALEEKRHAGKRNQDWQGHLTERVRVLDTKTPDQLEADRNLLIQSMRLRLGPDETMDEALAHVIVAVRNTLEIEPRLNQIMAARAMLHGRFVEMATGEGKTLAVAMAAGVAALSGTPVHVLTANDYLATRDASSLGNFYQYMGLHVASVVSSQETIQRRECYAADVVYVTAKQVAFDWLNDTLQMGCEPCAFSSRLSALTQNIKDEIYQPMLRGLCLAIVDEADSLLIDEARVPLILAASKVFETEEQIEAAIALGLAEKLTDGVDYKVMSAARHVRLTEAGQDELTTLSIKVAHSWRSSRFREARVSQALAALHVYQLDRDYIVADGQLVLTDPHTGRPMPDRRLPHGVHLLLELKEKCRPSAEHETVAKVSFPQFFGRYRGLVGISGTLSEVAGEVHDVYHRCFVPVASHCPSRRIDEASQVCLDRTAQLRVMVEDLQRRHALAQPVLVCTRSVEQSLGVSAFLTAHGLPHQVLNAYQDADEADIVACAGQAACITVATNMAGRGTDISLDQRAAESGGLHVVSLAFNDARRLDRQLAGRAARQGDPGSYQQIYSLDDAFLVNAMPSPVWKLACLCVKRGWNTIALGLIRAVQVRMEHQHRSERIQLGLSRERLEKQLAFSGESEQLS